MWLIGIVSLVSGCRADLYMDEPLPAGMLSRCPTGMRLTCWLSVGVCPSQCPVFFAKAILFFAKAILVAGHDTICLFICLGKV